MFNLKTRSRTTITGIFSIVLAAIYLASSSVVKAECNLGGGTKQYRFISRDGKILPIRAGTLSNGIIRVAREGRLLRSGVTAPASVKSMFVRESMGSKISVPWTGIGDSGEKIELYQSSTLVLDGKTIHPFRAWAYSEGISMFQPQPNGPWGGVDASGKVVIEPKLDDCASGFSEGLLGVKKDGKWGFIDHKGNWVIEPTFLGMAPFSNGLANVCLNTSGQSVVKKGYIDHRGRRPFETTYFEAGTFRNNRAIVGAAEGSDSVVKYGVINQLGQVLIPLKYDSIEYGEEGVYMVKVGRRCGYVDLTGKLVGNKFFSDFWKFSEGLAAVADEKSGLIGFIDHSGNYIIKPKFPMDRPSQLLPLSFRFREGLAAVPGEVHDFDASWGYIDKSGRWVIPPKYIEAGGFIEGLAMVRISSTSPDVGSIHNTKVPQSTVKKTTKH
jgi:hypothetical protein